MALSLLGTAVAALLAGAPLISRGQLLGPERTSPRLAPDGKRLAWLGPDGRNLAQLWVRRWPGTEELAVSAEPDGVARFSWTADASGLLYEVDEGGTEQLHVYLVDLATKNVRDLTPWQSVRARLLATSARQPDRVLVEANVRDRRLMDVWRVDLRTGAAELDTTNPGDVTKWLVDATLVVRGAVATGPEGATELRFREGPRSPFRSLIAAGPEEGIDALGFTDDGKAMYVTTSVDAETSRLVEKSLKTGAERELAANATSDVLATLGHPTRSIVRAVAFDKEGRRAWTAVDYAVRPDLEALAAALTGDFVVESMDGSDARWLIAELSDTSPAKYHLWDRKTKRLQALFSSAVVSTTEPLAPMAPVQVTSRDGLMLRGYLTRPLGATQPGALVIKVHDGPWRRDDWGFDGETQLWASRGYSVLQLNFRGSTGSGKRLVGAGVREWGQRMSDDLIDAVTWAVQQGVADPKRVAIAGQGYGGYAALVGTLRAPDVFACAVDRAGPSNLFTYLAARATGPLSADSQRLKGLGDPLDAADKERFARISPLFLVERLRASLLVAHGARDVDVDPSESEQLVAALEQRHAHWTSVVYSDEGHSFHRPENRLDFAARTEALFAECLGGPAEPLPREGRVAGSSALVRRAGAAPVSPASSRP